MEAQPTAAPGPPSRTELWQLKQSAQQLIVLADERLHFSTRLNKKEAANGTSAMLGDAFWNSNQLCSIPVNQISSLRVNNSRRSVRIVSAGRVVEAIGFESKSGGLLGRMGTPDTHRYSNPVSPTSLFGALIAELAGLELRGDHRADILHYELPTAIDVRSTLDPPTGTVVVRPWQLPMRLALILVWIVGVLAVFAWWSSFTVAVVILLLATPMLLAATASLIASIRVLVAGLTVDDHGVAYTSLLRRQSISWYDIELLHSVALDDWFIPRQIEIVRKGASELNLPLLTKSQVEIVAEAFVRFGTPHGIKSSVFPTDFARYEPDRPHTKSPINDRSRI